MPVGVPLAERVKVGVGVADAVGVSDGTAGAARTESSAGESAGMSTMGKAPTVCEEKVRQGCVPAGRMPRLQRWAQAGATPP